MNSIKVEENGDDSSDGSSVATTHTETSQASSKNSSIRRRRKKTAFSSKTRPSAQPYTAVQHGKKKTFDYRFSCYAKESHGQSIFGVAFNQQLQDVQRYCFAVAGSNKVSIYECSKDGGIILKSTYTDPDKDETFYVVVWTYDPDSMDALLLTAGGRGIIRIINPNNNKYRHLKGHGLAVNDLKIHPHDPNMLLSSSKDHSIRLWNLKTEVCIAIFGGVEGHRDEVLYADFHRTGSRIISSGMDHSLKIWSLESDQILTAMSQSYTYDHLKALKPFSTARVHFPNYTTRDIHRNYVDCVTWYGNFVLSKSCENSIVMWKPGKITQELDTFLPKNQIVSDASTTIIHQFDYTDGEIWYMRFSMDDEQRMMALGNMKGKAYVWDIDHEETEGYSHIILNHPKCTAAMRQTCLSNDGNILICVCDDSTIWRWDRTNIQNMD
jgi:polycomb protein EED